MGTAKSNLWDDLDAEGEDSSLAALNVLADEDASTGGIRDPGGTWADTGGGEDTASAYSLTGDSTTGYPTALSQYGTQTSDFSTRTGLSNPLLMPLLMVYENYPTSLNEFEPTVQEGSPVATRGTYDLATGARVPVSSGSTLSSQGIAAPTFKQPTPVGNASGLPGALDSYDQFAGEFGGGGGGGGRKRVGGGGGGDEGGVAASDLAYLWRPSGVVTTTTDIAESHGAVPIEEYNPWGLPTTDEGAVQNAPALTEYDMPYVYYEDPWLATGPERDYSGPGDFDVSGGWI